MKKPARKERPRAELDDVRAFAIAAACIARDHKVENVSVLDLRGLSNLADYFVLGTGTSGRQMHAVLDYIAEHAAALEREPFNVADATDASWLLADYVDVVIHLFDEEHRSYYDLDSLWGDAPRVPWQATEGDSRAAAELEKA